MSFCRWSNDGGQCDLYCYECVDGGFVTHVAGLRRPKRVSDYDFSSVDALAFSTKRRQAELRDPANEPRPIGLPHDGESFVDDDLPAMLERIISLRALGYQCPDAVLDGIREEIAEGAEEEERLSFGDTF